MATTRVGNQEPTSGRPQKWRSPDDLRNILAGGAVGELGGSLALIDASQNLLCTKTFDIADIAVKR
jgi:hypothetical protein